MDLSAVGMRIQSIAVLDPRTVVEGTLIVSPTQSIRLRAVVIWATPPDHRGFVPAELGLELLEVPENYLQTLAELFAESS